MKYWNDQGLLCEEVTISIVLKTSDNYQRMFINSFRLALHEIVVDFLKENKTFLNFEEILNGLK